MPDPLDFSVSLASVRGRLDGLGYFLSVTDILDASQALDDNVAASPPAAFVGVSSERASPNKLVGGHRQRVEVRVAVLFAESAARFDRTATKDRMEETRKAIIRNLIGWQPDGAERPFNYAGYDVVRPNGGIVWGEVRMDTSYHVGS